MVYKINIAGVLTSAEAYKALIRLGLGARTGYIYGLQYDGNYVTAGAAFIAGIFYENTERKELFRQARPLQYYRDQTGLDLVEVWESVCITADYTLRSANSGIQLYYGTTLTQKPPVRRNASFFDVCLAAYHITESGEEIVIFRDDPEIFGPSYLTDQLSEILMFDIVNGGHGETTAEQARNALEMSDVSHSHSANDLEMGTLPFIRGGTGAQSFASGVIAVEPGGLSPIQPAGQDTALVRDAGIIQFSPIGKVISDAYNDLMTTRGGFLNGADDCNTRLDDFRMYTYHSAWDGKPVNLASMAYGASGGNGGALLCFKSGGKYYQINDYGNFNKFSMRANAGSGWGEWRDG